VTDVYEFTDGHVRLVSGGKHSTTANLFAASESGDDVFFATADGLAASDGDGGSIDIYDARIGGGFANASRSPQCVGDGCQGQATKPVDAQQAMTGTVRPEPPAASARPRARLKAIGAAVRASLARRGSAVLLAGVNRAGTVTVTARAKIGKRVSTVASARVKAAGSGTVKIPIRLSSGARQELQRRHRLRVTVALRFTGQRESHTLVFNLIKRGR
jgi:hypothetical protein